MERWTKIIHCKQKQQQQHEKLYPFKNVPFKMFFKTRELHINI